jgi:hypothetical protein
MQYMTMTLEILKQRPQLYEQLRREHKLLPALKTLALSLKSRHERWKEQLLEARPGTDPAQIASEALEPALQEFTDSLPGASPQEDQEFSLDQAMAFLLRPTPPA